MTLPVSRLLRTRFFSVAFLLVVLLVASSTLSGCFRAENRPAPRIETPTGPGEVKEVGFDDFETTIVIDDSLDFEVTAERRSRHEESVSFSIDVHSSSPVEDPAAFGFATELPLEESDPEAVTLAMEGTAAKAGTIVLALTATDGWATTEMRFSITVVGEVAEIVFTQQPTAGEAGEILEPALTLELRDEEGSVVNTNATVELALEANPGEAVLDGTLAVDADNGVATFDDLSLDRAAAGYVLQASSDILAASSDPFDISPRLQQLLPDILFDGYSVTVHGQGFSDNPANNLVEFEGTPGNVTAASATELTVEVPSSVAAGLLGVTIDGLASNPLLYHLSPFPVTAADRSLETHSVSVSENGRFIAFVSDTDIPQANDNNGEPDVFVVDRLAGVLALVSRTSLETSGNGASFAPMISGDGRFIVFASDASDLVAGDNNSVTDVFRFELSSGEIELVSQTTAGVIGNGPSYAPSISHDGSRIAFVTEAQNLGGGDTVADVVVRDMDEEETFLVSVDTNGDKGLAESNHPAISPDGQFVAFASRADNLHNDKTTNVYDIFLRDIDGETTELISRDENGNAPTTGDSIRPSVSTGGTQVAFETTAALVSADQDNESDIYVRDVVAEQTILVSVNEAGNASGDDGSYHASISGDGNEIAFASDATDLVSGVTNGFRDIYRHDVNAASTVRLSVSNAGEEANNASDHPHLTRNGHYLAFETLATDIEPGGVAGVETLVLGLDE